LLERGAGCALLVVWTELEPEPVACEQRKDVKMDVVRTAKNVTASVL